MALLLGQQANSDLTVLLLMAWLVLGPWMGYRIGKPKGRESLGIVLGLLLGVFGWMILALLPSDENPAPNIDQRRVLRRPCPYCAEDIKTGATVCHYCNREVDPIEIDELKDPYWQPTGWDAIPRQVFRQLRDRFPNEVEQLRDAQMRNGDSKMSERQVRKCIAAMVIDPALSADQSLNKPGWF